MTDSSIDLWPCGVLVGGGRINPKHREQKFSTAVAKEGGKNPVWNEEFVFEITTEKEIAIEVSCSRRMWA